LHDSFQGGSPFLEIKSAPFSNVGRLHLAFDGETLPHTKKQKSKTLSNTDVSWTALPMIQEIRTRN
jgi:hypothetical protein